MATIAGAGSWVAKGVHRKIWTPLANGDDGAPAAVSNMGNHEWQFTGTFGVGGTIIVEGSNDGTNWFPLKDWQGTNISKTAAGGATQVDNPLYTRPRVTGGDGTTSLTASLVTTASLGA